MKLDGYWGSHVRGKNHIWYMYVPKVITNVKFAKFCFVSGDAM